MFRLSTIAKTFSSSVFMSLLFYVYWFCLSGECKHNSLISGSLSVFKRGRGLTFTSAHVLVPSTCRWARLATHRHNGPHQVCSPCSLAHLGRTTTACVSSPERRGSLHRLSTCSVTWTFFWAPHLGAPFPLFDTVQVRTPRSPKNADIFPETWLSSVRAAPRV